MKFKRFISLLAATAMAVTALTSAMSVSAETDSGDCGEVKWSFDSSTGKLTIFGQGKMSTPDIPDGQPRDDYTEVYTYKAHKEDIKEVVIEEGVTLIGFCAFYKFPNLETVVLPSTINDSGGYNTTAYGVGWDKIDYAFAECKSLKNLTLTDGMTALGGYSFYGCTSLESVTIPSTVADWGNYSFYQCSSLKNITLSEGLTVIGANAFVGASVKSVVIPSTIVEWNQSVHRDRILGRESIMPLYLRQDNDAFADCTKLSSVTFNDGIKAIEGSAFRGCSSLKKVFIPKSVTEMEYAFAYCTGLEEAYIEDGAHINGLGSGACFQNAFYSCENLKKLEIPEGVEIDSNDPQWCTGCTSLTDLYIHGKDYTHYIPMGNDFSRFHCYFDTSTYNALISQNKLTSERLIKIEDTISKAKDTLNKKLEEAKALNENDYTAESYAALKTAIDNAEKFDENSTQIMPMQWAAGDITSATRKLEEKPQPADYTAVDAALAKIPSDLSIYTDESVEALNDAKEAVVRDLTIDEQERVNGFANAIEEAIAGLKKKQNSDKPQNPNPNTNKPNQPTSSKDKGKTPTNKVTVPKPAQVKSVKATAKKKKLNVKWKKVSGATGYEVMYATNNKFTKGKKTVKVKKNKVTLKKLKAKKKYFVKVRAYKKVKGNVSYGKWSKVVKKKVK